jgi:SAM-dependent methyltransferase
MKTPELELDAIKSTVRERYGQIADKDGSCGCAPTCCGKGEGGTASAAEALGYSPEEIAAAPEGANLGLGCGNPLAIASLQPGQTVLDLGSGAGFDAFLAARAVGPSGRVIGVDMTPSMISKARRNAASSGLATVEFRLGEIEHLPVADDSADVIVSNCVINLSPDKAQVFRDAFRVLKPGGRLAISDVVALQVLPDSLRKNWEFYTGCVTGAASVAELNSMLAAAGFQNIRIEPKSGSREVLQEWFPGQRLEDYVASATIEAVKPAR